jgi:hypothetical protein
MNGTITFAANAITQTFWEVTIGGVQVNIEDRYMGELAKRWLQSKGEHVEIQVDGKPFRIKGAF